MTTTRTTAYLDGLRGFAAAQVILLHYFTAFIPVLAFPGPYRGWSGFTNILGGTFLYYFYDGNSAIDLFFLLSGYVLTLSYLKKTSSAWELILGRTLRLGIPVSCSLVIAWALFAIFPYQHEMAGLIAHSRWLEGLCNLKFNTVSHLKEIFFGSILLGYGESSFWFFFPSANRFIHPLDTAFSPNFPLWTLNIEYYGSLLIILVSLLFKKSRPLYLVFLIALFVYFQPFGIALFFVGHLFALNKQMFSSERPYAAWISAPGSLVSWISIGLAVWMSSRGFVFPWLSVHFRQVPLHLLEKSVGSILIFGSVLFFRRAGVFGRPLIALFESRFFQFLGRRSFAVYLLHIPILFTLGSYFYIDLSLRESQPAALTQTILIGIFFTYWISGFFEKYIDERAILFSKDFPAKIKSRYALAISKARSAKPCTTE